MVRLIISSFQETETGRFTLANYGEAYGNIRHLQALLNSLELGVGVAVLACLFGVPIAWAISRTDMPAKGFVRLMVFGAFIIPPYLGAIGWILLAGPNSGWLNKVWMALTGAEHGIFNIYSMTGPDPGRGGDVVSLRVRVHQFARSISCPPKWRMRRISSAPARCAPRFRVTLPLVLPAIVGGLIISLSGSDRAVRRARADRAARALQRGLDAALAVLRISGARRGGRRLCDAAARSSPC